MEGHRSTVIVVVSWANGGNLRLSYENVDSYIGKLRSIFQANGRDGEWDRQLGLGNPTGDKLVKD